MDIGSYTTYAVFATTASPGAGTPQDARFGIGLGDGTTDQLNDASFNGTIANITDFDIGLTEWTPYVSDGTSYNFLEVNFTIENANDYLIMIAEDTSSGSPQGVLVGLQIVQTAAIPEPSTLGLLTLGLGVLLRCRRNLALT